MMTLCRKIEQQVLGQVERDPHFSIFFSHERVLSCDAFPAADGMFFIYRTTPSLPQGYSTTVTAVP